MKEWILPEEIIVDQAVQAFVGGRPLVAEILNRRGLRRIEAIAGFLDPDRYHSASAFDLPGMSAAVERLARAVDRQETILVWGDFDVDGQTATTLLQSALGRVNPRVVYHVPVRAQESHGVGKAALEGFLDHPENLPGWRAGYPPISLIITCDTGVSAHAGLKSAQQRGVDVIVTDHHELPPELPPALAMINPQFLPGEHALRTLPGVGVAYKLIEAFYTRLDRLAEMDEFLDLVALGIVADVAQQRGEARYLLQRGLLALRKSNRRGLLALFELAGIEQNRINEETIAYEIAPRLNAIGRLGDANPVVELLTTIDLGLARTIALQIEGMNNQRRLLTEQVYQAALAQLAATPEYLDRAAIVLSHPTWPAGILGIVASRLVERYAKPAALIAAPEGQVARGSVRSIVGVPIADVLQANATLFENYGGHALAGGFALDPGKINDLRIALDLTIRRYGPLSPAELLIDARLGLAELSLELVEDLERLAPFGAGNPPLVFAAEKLRLLGASPLGRDGEHLAINITDQAGNSQQVIYWQGASAPLPDGVFDLAFTARPVDYRGRRSLQLQWIDYRPVASESAYFTPAYQPEFEDYRRVANSLVVLKNLLAQYQAQIWAEADAIGRLAAMKLEARQRVDLLPGLPLVIWTAPPHPAVLQDILFRVKPSRVFLFSVAPGTEYLNAFLTRLVGLVKYHFSSNSQVLRLEQLAGGLAQTEAAARLGLAWLKANGRIDYTDRSDHELILSPGGAADPSLLPGIQRDLEILLDEARAYRLYYARLEPEKLWYIKND